MCPGELSEEQKVELERQLSRVKRQEGELNLLREKLSQMSSLVEKKDRALEAAAEELRYMPKCSDALPKVLCSFPAAGGIEVCPQEQKGWLRGAELSSAMLFGWKCHMNRSAGWFSGAHARGRVTKSLVTK